MIKDEWKFQLACLIGKSIGEIEELPMDELIYWQFYLSEPRGDLRDDFRAGQITQAIYSIGQSFAKNPKPVKMEDCILKFNSKSEDERIKKINHLKLMAKAFADVQNKKLNKPKTPAKQKQIDKKIEKAKKMTPKPINNKQSEG